MKSHDFKKLAQIESNARLRTRYLAISHFLNDISRADIARYLKVSRTSVNAWVHKYLNQGIDGLNDGKSPGRPCTLTALELEKSRQHVELQSISVNGGRLQARDIQNYISTEFNADFKLGIYIGSCTNSAFPGSLVGPGTLNKVKRHKRFLKTFLLETILNTPGHMALERMDV